MLTTQQAAERLGVQRIWVWKLIKAGRLRAAFNEQFGQWLIEEQDLLQIKGPERPRGRPRKQ